MQSLWMIAASVLFACMGVCVKLGAAQFSAGELAFWRGAVATLLLGGYAWFRGLPLSTEHAGAHVKRGASGFVSLLMYYYAISLIPLATAVTLNYTSPLFLALLLAWWLREPARPSLYAALAIGFVGVAVLLQPTLSGDQWLGALLGLLSGVISSVAYFNVRRLGELGEPEWRTVFYFSALVTLCSLPWVWLGDGLHKIDLRGGLLLLGVGGFGAAAQVCMTAAYARGKTLAAASLAYSTVVFSSIFAMFLWQETLPWLAWGGVALIVCSGMATTLLARRAPAAAS